MRIVVVIYSLDGGGAERVSCHLANAWAEQGHEVAFITLKDVNKDAYNLGPNVERIGLGVDTLSGNFIIGLLANLRRIHVLRSALKKIQPDVIIGMMTTAGVLSVFSSIGQKWIVIPAERTHPPQVPIGWFWEILRRWLYPKAAYVITLSEESRKWIESNCPGTRSVVIPNPVVLPLPELGPRLDPEDYIYSSDLIILAVGRLGWEKGFDRLIEAFAEIADSFPAWRLVIMGEGNDRNALTAQIDRAGLKNRILLPGRAGNIAQWYKRADLYVLSSHFEGFPNGLIEAMAYGLPAISFDCDTGPRDIIRNGIDGLLVSPGDVVALTDALANLMGDELGRNKMALRAIEVSDRYTMSRILAEWDKVFFAAQEKH